MMTVSQTVAAKGNTIPTGIRAASLTTPLGVIPAHVREVVRDIGISKERETILMRGVDQGAETGTINITIKINMTGITETGKALTLLRTSVIKNSMTLIIIDETYVGALIIQVIQRSSVTLRITV